MKSDTKSILILVYSVFAIVVLFTSFTIVDAGHRGVVFSKTSGIKDRVLDEGFHFIVPFIDSVTDVEVRTKKVTIETGSTSLDQQIVNTIGTLNFHVSEEQANKLYQSVGLDYINRIISPALEGTIKSVMAKYPAVDLTRKREEVAIIIRDELAVKLRESYIIVDSFELNDIDFSDSFNLAIEAAVTAEKEVEQEKNKLSKRIVSKDIAIVNAEAKKAERVLEAEGQAEATLLKARAEAEAIQLVQEKLDSSPEYIEYLRVTKWNGELPTTLLGESDVLLSVSGD